ncbi:MAG: 5-(carboxyamino)imidazole ribonucleotide synthase, partial [Legionellales bacterium]
MKIGILGAGQLARMLTLAAYPLGWRTLCFDPSAEACASDVTRVIQADYTDETQLQHFASQVDLITLENENVPVSCLEKLATYCPVYPNATAIGVAQDRLQEKQLFQHLAIPTPSFLAINTQAELIAGCQQIGMPAVLKTRRFGYDGKGQYIIRTLEDIDKAWATLGAHALILESWVKFDREVSLIAARNTQGETQFYPLVENIHKMGMLHISRAPFIDSGLTQQAQQHVTHLLDQLNYVGVLTVEFFACGHQLIANEMAPRVHNSGHWTIEGAVTSQFAQHLRAICGLPLGNTATRDYSALLNCIGEEPEFIPILQQKNAYYHCYHKTPKPLRKLAHITVNAPTQEEREQQLAHLMKINPFSIGQELKDIVEY